MKLVFVTLPNEVATSLQCH